MNARFVTSSGLAVDIVPATLHRLGSDRANCRCEPPALMRCRVPATLMTGARSGVEVNFTSVVTDAHEVVFLLMKAGGAAAALVFDLVGEHAQTALRLALARGCLDIGITDDRATEVVRCAAVGAIADLVARSARRSAAGPDGMAVCMRRFLDWLDTPEALEELGVRLDASSQEPRVVLSLFVEESTAQRFVGANEL